MECYFMFIRFPNSSLSTESRRKLITDQLENGNYFVQINLGKHEAIKKFCR
jgi:hypothetical protein